MTEIPNEGDLARYLKSDRVDPLDLSESLAAALAEQASRCVVDPYTDPLREAALRRAARILAGRGAPLGTLDLGPMGTSPLVRFDAHIETLEGPYRKAPIG